ncbi:methylmalonyl-CoA mutase family protein [Rossellomorea aquimaris]|uniref:methylmalonyl-CoA mutase family protein n=1 Tax=Rossellomorea aquimaris TaxID=189382 RepID=UPI0007D08C93|nr:methylmalonyl-CoA mutase family protein [Rossellomorea aquimaris]
MKLSEMKNQSFNTKSLEEWQEVAKAALKGKTLDSLHTHTYEGIELKPLYTKNDSPLNDRIRSYIPNVESKIEGTSWFIAQPLKGISWGDLTDKVRDSLSRGQNCFSFSTQTLPINEEFDQFFTELTDSETPIFSIEKSSSTLINRISALSKKHQNIRDIKGVVGFDSISEQAFLHENLSFDKYLGSVEEAKDNIPGVKTIVVNTAPYHNNGANAVQELAYALSEGVSYIERLIAKGWVIDEIAEKMHFHFSVGSHFFMEVSKIRAFKKLWQEILSSYGLANEVVSRSISTSAETSKFNKSTLDSYVNMLRSGGEAFSAILSGVDYLVVLPFNDVSGETNALSERVARNTQLILAEEAHLNKVVDPSGGSYYVEWLSEEIGKKAWKEFQEIDAKGGILAELENGSIQERVREVKEARIHDLSTRKQSMIGTNIYANLGDRIPTPHTSERMSLPFEKLRYRAQRLTENGSKPVAGIIGLGLLKSHKPRADFVSGFLATGGIQSTISPECFSKEDVLQFVEETKLPYYIVCGKDEAYDELVPMIVESIKNIDSKIVIDLAGKVKESSSKHFKELGLNGSVYAKQNILEKLEELLTIWEEGKDHDKA